MLTSKLQIDKQTNEFASTAADRVDDNDNNNYCHSVLGRCVKLAN